MANNPVAYRYGFNGKEKDNEIKGEGNSLNYKYRMHDPRLGRFFAVDPLAADFPWNSSYAFSENRVIDAFELEGLESVVINKVEGNEKATTENRDFGYTSLNVSNNPNVNIDTKNKTGPLGSGTFTNTLMKNGSYSTTWNPDAGNPIKAYTETSVKGWKKDGDLAGGWGTYLNATLQEKTVENALIELGFSESDVRIDVIKRNYNDIKLP